MAETTKKIGNASLSPRERKTGEIQTRVAALENRIRGLNQYAGRRSRQRIFAGAFSRPSNAQ